MEASVSWFDFDWVNSGMNLSMFSSSMHHSISQFVLARTRIVLINIAVVDRMENGEYRSIKIWRS